MEERLRRDIALFRYGVIADLVHDVPDGPGLYARIREKAQEEWRIPGTLRTRVAVATMRDWLRAYREGGFDALLPRGRGDAGQSRAIPSDVADVLLTLKDDHRDYSVSMIIDAARTAGVVQADLVLAPSTVHRLLARHGLMQKEPEEPTGKDHRRFAFQKAGDLWMSDVMHGPAVCVAGRQRRKTYLIGFIDDATRVIPNATFALSESTEAFLPVLKTAILRRGCPRRLFVDNGSAYRSHHLELVCAKLGITLIHARAYHPQAKGKQERWFRTVRMQLLPLLTEADLRDLDALNARLGAWVEGKYHLAPHRGLDGEAPLDRWARVADEVRYLQDSREIDDLFLTEARRVVQRDRTVSLDGVVYEVDASLVRETVTLRYDPSRRGRPIQVWHQDRHVHDAQIVDAYANCFVKRDRPSCTLVPADKDAASDPIDGSTVPAPAPGLRLAGLANTHDKEVS